MTHIEDEYKKRFNDQELPNDDFDSEDLWDAISEDLDNDEVKGGGKKRFIWFFLLFFGVGIMGGTYYFNSNKPGVAQNSISEKASEGRNENEIASIRAIESPSQSQSLSDEKTITQGQNDKGISSGELASLENAISTGQMKIVDQLSKPSSAKDTKVEVQIAANNISHSKEIKVIDRFERPNDLNSNENLIVNLYNEQEENTKNYKGQIVEKKEERKAVNLPVKPSQKDGLEADSEIVEANPSTRFIEDNTASQLPVSDSINKSIETETRLDLAIVDTTIQNVGIDTAGQIAAIDTASISELPAVAKKPGKMDIAFEIGGWRGFNILNLNFNPRRASDLGEFKKRSEKGGEFGKSFGISSALVWKQKWVLNLGFEYHELWSEFDFEQDTDIEVFKENQVVKVWRDGITGEIIKTKTEDVVVDAVATRKVIHHNKYQRFSIPIEFGLQKRKSNLVYGIAVGGVLNFTTKQSGKTLDKNTEIIDFDENSSSAPFKPFTVGLRLSSFAGYRITKRLTIKIQPQCTLVPFGEFDGTDIRINTQQFNLNVGLGYFFD